MKEKVLNNKKNGMLVLILTTLLYHTRECKKPSSRTKSRSGKAKWRRIQRIVVKYLPEIDIYRKF